MTKSLFLFFILIHQLSHAQTPTMIKGYVIYSLGTDTTFIGYYQLHNNSFQLKVMSRPNLSVAILKGTFFPNGELQEAIGYSYKPSLAGEEKRLVDYVLSVKDDTTFIRQIRDGKEINYKFPGHAMIANALGNTFIFFLPLLVNYAPAKVGESISSYHYVLGRKRDFTIKRIAEDVVEVGSQVMGYFKLYLHPNRKLKFIDGVGSSWNVKGEVFDEIDLDAYIQKFVQKEQTASLKPLNQKDSVISHINSVDIRIDYSRPSKRGRIIFGEVVPWNRVWRTGANEPTTLNLNNSIYFDGKELPSGKYSIFTLPAREGWTLIINRQTDMWGTDYDPAFDVLRIPMKSKRLKEPVELMTIDIKQKNKKGVLNISWDVTNVYVPFTLKK